MTLTTSAIAWYGAVLSTATLLFNLWKYTRERARLQVRIVPTWYDDGGFSKVEKTEHGEISTPIIYFHVEVLNVGERPTSIMGVSATTRISGWKERLLAPKPRFGGTAGVAGSAFTVHDGKKTPYLIGPGGAWSCRVKQDQILSLVQSGIPKLEIHAACWKGPMLVVFPVSEKGSVSVVRTI